MIKQSTETLGTNLQTAWNNIKSKAGEIWDALKVNVSTIVDNLKLAISTTVENLGTALQNAWTNIKNKAEEIWNALKSVVSTIADNLRIAITNTVEILRSALQTAWTNIKTKAEEIWNALKSSVSTIAENLKLAVSNTIENLRSGLQTTWTNIKSKAEEIWNALKSTVSTIVSNLKSGVEGIIGNLKTALDTAWANIKSAAETAWNNLKSGVEGIVSSMKSALATAAQGFSDIGNAIVQGIWSGISAATDWIQQKISGWVGDVEKFLKDLFGIQSPSKLMRNEIGRWLPPGIAEGVEDAMPAALSSMKQTINSAVDSLQNDAKSVNIGRLLVDDSAVKNYTPNLGTDFASAALSHRVQSEVALASAISTQVDGSRISEGIRAVIQEEISPLLTNIDTNTQRQADKKEIVNVEIGRKSIKDAVVSQTTADGFSFTPSFA